MMKLKVAQVGTKYTYKYAIYCVDKRKEISFWHDVPLFNLLNKLNFVCEIPRNTRAKMEVAIDEDNTPIKQDVTKDGKLRYYPYNIKWNYGMLPQTWEDPSHTWSEIGGLPGDGDPLDVIEISRDVKCEIGHIYAVKVVGALALIDEGEVDWKILAIRCDSANSAYVNDVDDIDRVYPGALKSIKDWFRNYKVPAGKPPNTFGLHGRALTASDAMNIVDIGHNLYREKQT